MSQSPRPMPPLFSQVDVTAGVTPPSVHYDEHTELLREVLAAQDRTNELLEELVSSTTQPRKQKANELKHWKEANPELSRCCHAAAEALTRVQVDYLNQITEEINDTADAMMDGEFMLNEFVDRFGPRLAHLNGVIQVLAQLACAPNSSVSDE